MLAVSALRSANKDESQGEMASGNFTMDTQEFPDFSDTNLLDSIVLDDLFLGIDDGYVLLPDLEMDPADVLAEFSVSGGDGEDSEMNTSVEKAEVNLKKEEEDKVSGSASGLGSSLSKGEEIVSKRDEPTSLKALARDGDKGRKSSSQTKNNNNNQGKRKVKVDWTPELHRRFVQAVEQLGVDKAVPSRILELMGIDCLTRHNIASHLQKYRSHRKHLLAREAEAASLSQRKQMAGGGGGKRDINPWLAPTIGFPPKTPPMHPHHHFIRPLHVWGHPTMDQTLMHVWPKPVAHSPTPLPPQSPVSVPPSWAHRPCPPYWHHHQQQQQVPKGTTRGTPCFPQALATTRFPALPVPGIPPHHHAIYKVEPPGIGFPTAQSGPHPLIDFHPSKESIDAAIGDVISKPWLPLPLGLKPPSIDSVMGELQRQGLPKIPPTSCA